MTSDLNRDLLLLWLRENAEEHRRRASKARNATRRPTGSYGVACVALSAAHDAAADLYERFAEETTGAQPPTESRACLVTPTRAEAVLTNGAAIVLKSDGLYVVDADGHAIGAWALSECDNLSTPVLFRDVLELAIRGCRREDVAPQTERSAS